MENDPTAQSQAQALFAQGVELSQRRRDDVAVDLYERAIVLAPGQPVIHTKLAIALLRLGRLGEAALHCERAIELNPEDAVSKLNLGIVRLQEGNGPAAESLLRGALAAEAQPLEPQGRGVAHFRLAELYAQRHDAHRREQDLLDAIAELTAALGYPAPPDRVAARQMHLANLQWSLYQNHAHASALPSAVELYRAAAASMSPETPDRAHLGEGLGRALRALYLRERDPEQLEEARRELQAAVEAHRADGDRSERAPGTYTNLANVHSDRYYLLNDPADLRAALTLIRRGVELTSEDDPLLELRETNLASKLLALYRLDGNVDELNEAIRIYERVVDADDQGRDQTSIGVSRQATSDLAGALKARFLALRDRQDLDRCMVLLKRAAERPNPAQPRSGPASLANLAEGLALLANEDRDQASAAQAAQIADRAIDQTPVDDIAYPNRISQKGLALLTSYELQADPVVLDEAIVTLESAMSAAESRPQFRPGAAHRLANAMRLRWLRDGEPSDWEGAAAAIRAGLDVLPDGSPDRPIFFADLARLALDRFAKSRSQQDLLLAIQALEEAWELLTGEFTTLPVDFKVGSARRHAEVPQRLVAAHLDAAQLHLDGVEGEQHLRRAWEVAEASKSRILADYLTRVELPDPPGVPSGLLDRERELLDALQRLDAIGLAQAPIAQEDAKLATLAARAKTRTELEQVWQQIGASGRAGASHVQLRHPQSPSFDQLLQRLRAQVAPTAILSLISLSQMTVLMVLTGRSQMPLIARSSWSEADWDELLERIAQELPLSAGDDRIPQTWHQHLLELLDPVLEELLAVEHLIIVPSGRSMMVPWLALFQLADRNDAGERRLFVSLCPTVSALLAPVPAHSQPAGDELVVGNPTGDLRFAEGEARSIAARLKTTPLLGRSATAATVLPQLGRASVAHLATHGFITPGLPLESGLAMADQPLTGRDVLSMRVKARLVVLSACDTGIVQGLGGEEFAGLSQAFISAGARSMIVSLWPVDDDATARLMSHFYDGYLEHRKPERALTEATDQLRAEGMTHPYFWGAFSCLTGALEEA